MPKQIDKLRKIKYKASRLRGNSIAQGLRDAGYSEGRARISSGNTIVKVCERELVNEISKKDITIDWVLNNLASELTKTDCKASDRIRVNELLGKWLNMFRDNNIQQTTLFLDTKAQEDAKKVINDVNSVSV